jgi:hypothetical protein
MIPQWLHLLAMASLGLAALCAVIIAVDEFRHPQKMWIMNLVWPLTALFGSVVWTWGYWRFGRLSRRDLPDDAKTKEAKPFPVMVAEAASHCGSGCTLGDIAAETAVLAFPGLAVLFGLHSLFAERLFAVWILDYIAAYLIGIVFQYFTIAPMRHLGLWQGLWAAAKADTLSLTAWQVGMYGFMAIAQFLIFMPLFGTRLEASMPEFWFMMQIAMLCGFMTVYPVNWWLLRAGLKEKM